MAQSYTAARSTITRTLLLWFMSNVGGTLWLAIQFSLDQLDDYSIALMAGLLAAIISLPLVGLAIPFFTLVKHVSRGWSRPSMAVLGVVLFFALSNLLLLCYLPFMTLNSLLEMSLPYLGAALLALAWLYTPAGQTSTTSYQPQKVRAEKYGRLLSKGMEYRAPKIRVQVA